MKIIYCTTVQIDLWQSPIQLHPLSVVILLIIFISRIAN